MAAGPLEGNTILDLTRLLPGPLAAQYMADLGATVIKVEDYNYPDYIRFFPPQIEGHSVHYLAINRSKQSVALDLSGEDGKEVFYDLVKQADIVLEGFRPGKIDALGLGYDRAAEVNPGIIYVSISGYGQSGPLSGQAGHDLNYVGYAGLIAMGGRAGHMVMPGVQIADIMGGTCHAVIGSLAALQARSRTGKGQQVDVSMTDCSMQMLAMPLSEYLNTGTSYDPGSFMLSGGLANYHIYRCKDARYVALGALEPKFWTAFCSKAERPDWTARAIGDTESTEALKSELEVFFADKTRDEWMDFFADTEACISPVLGLDEIEAHPHTRERGLIAEVEHPQYGTIKGIAQPLKFSRTETGPGSAPPLLGEHTSDVLRSIGYAQDHIGSLIERGVVLQAPENH